MCAEEPAVYVPPQAADDHGVNTSSASSHPGIQPPPGLGGVSTSLPSVGSVGHEDGSCKRCIFFPRGRCEKDVDCPHCHYDHTDRAKWHKWQQRLKAREKRAAKKECKEMLRNAGWWNARKEMAAAEKKQAIPEMYSEEVFPALRNTSSEEEYQEERKDKSAVKMTDRSEECELREPSNFSELRLVGDVLCM